MPHSRWTARFAERACLAIFFAWLIWLPLPFGSIVERARLPLIAVPLALCRLRVAAPSLRDARPHEHRPADAWPGRSGASARSCFSASCALQLVPLAPGVLRALSPESHAIWSAASQVASLAGVAPRSDVAADGRSARDARWSCSASRALFATFTTAALLIRTHARRRVLACALCAAAVFESLYGLREAALQRYEIWGWVNRLIFDRVTGTFVNPNHFAHYLAIVLPMALFLGASRGTSRARRDAPLPRRLAALIERHALLTGFALLAAIACVGGDPARRSRAARCSPSARRCWPSRRCCPDAASRASRSARPRARCWSSRWRCSSARAHGRRASRRRVRAQTFVSRRVRHRSRRRASGSASRSSAAASARSSAWCRWSRSRTSTGSITTRTTTTRSSPRRRARSDSLVAMVTLIGGYVALVRDDVRRRARTSSRGAAARFRPRRWPSLDHRHGARAVRFQLLHPRRIRRRSRRSPARRSRRSIAIAARTSAIAAAET